MTDPAILVITSKRDCHVARVADHLEDRGIPWVRINTEDVASNVKMTVCPATGKGSLQVIDSDRRLDLSGVGAVWYRKPEPPDLSHFALDQAGLDYVEAELQEILQGLYALLRNARWLNHPLTTRLAHRKLYQLQIAQQAGFQVPRTIVTNRREDALIFAQSVGFDVAIKSLGALCVTASGERNAIQYGIFTRRVSKEELLAVADKITHLPTLFQEYVQKQYELRVTCVGSKVFACRIDSQASDLSREDYRFDSSVRHQWEAYPSIEAKLHRYLELSGLNFGCFDLVVSDDGTVTFLECNPNGQWLWIEERTDAPIGAAIADLLAGQQE